MSVTKINGCDLDVLYEVFKSLGLYRSSEKEDCEVSLKLDSLIKNELDAISNPATEDMKILSSLCTVFSSFTSKGHFKEFMSQLMTRMILDSSNATIICKYMYLLHSLHSSIKNEYILQTFNQVMRETLNGLGELLYCYGFYGLKSFAMYFMAGVHFMRNFASSPDDFLRSKLLEIAHMFTRSPKKVEALKTFCLLLLRYYHYCYTFDDDKNDGDDNSDWSRFETLQAMVIKEYSVDRLKKDVAVFVGLVTKPCQLKDHGYISYIQSVLSKSDYEDLIPSFIIRVPSSHEEYFQTTFGSSRYLHYE